MNRYLPIVSFLFLTLAVALHFGVPRIILIPAWITLLLAYVVAGENREKFMILLPYIVGVAAAFMIPLPLPDGWTVVQKFVTVIAVWTAILILLHIAWQKFSSPEERAAQRGEPRSSSKIS